MRVLLSTDIVGGVWRYTVTLVRELVARGHTCAVAVVGAPNEERLAQLPDTVERFSRPLRLEWMPGGLADVPAGTAWLEQLARDWEPDVVHLNQFAYATGDFPAPVVVVAHSDVLSWFEEVRGEPAPEEWAPYVAAVRAGMAAADVIVAPTAYQSGLLARHYGRSAVRVIHNGAVAAAPPRERPATPASERPLVLVAGRAWDAGKGIDLLDRAVALLGDEAPPVHLVGPLTGPGGERIEVEHLVTHGEVPAPAMRDFYERARVYVAPSRYEPFGLSPLEAAGHGCALLLSGIGSFRELWAGTADFFEPLHPELLAVRLRDLVDDAPRLDALAAGARLRARERYTTTRMADQYERLYEMIAPEGARASAGWSVGNHASP